MLFPAVSAVGNWQEKNETVLVYLDNQRGGRQSCAIPCAVFVSARGCVKKGGCVRASWTHAPSLSLALLRVSPDLGYACVSHMSCFPDLRLLSSVHSICLCEFSPPLSCEGPHHNGGASGVSSCLSSGFPRLHHSHLCVYADLSAPLAAFSLFALGSGEHAQLPGRDCAGEAFAAESRMWLCSSDLLSVRT